MLLLPLGCYFSGCNFESICAKPAVFLSSGVSLLVQYSELETLFVCK
uniref:Uncharacterized protein n=1 Tax=Anguilla anguilla TaxID=7936 RepID=A0A0E9VIQ8_ANGAN